ncbi:helix-turn-helix domain-containing protein [Leptolyngbya iicbica]|uniref:Helix-turn-helix domain-containing protein n=1 Tax=Lyngbya confervoides BDU141951 TaxID=1574623 RepID=A0A0C1Y5B4_9CYAN|nr:RodZ domain-containing protein [Leptolyngbya sp. LK]
MNPAQQEQLSNVGAYLRDLRKEQGTTIDEVANQIFIRPALVAAIESGDWESLPEPVFVQGFIRRYADYLGLDGREISQQFEPTPVAVLPDPVLATSSTVEGVVKQQDKHGLKVLSKAEPVPSNGSLATSSSGGASRNWILGIIGLAAVVGLITWAVTRPAPEPSTAQSDTETPETSTEAADAIAPDEVDPDEADPDEADAPTTTPSDGLTFAVNLEQDAWMRVTVDGEVAYEGILAAGSQETWTGENEIRITSGNSGGVLFSFNGSEEQPLGQPGAVRNLTLTPDTDAETLASP